MKCYYCQYNVDKWQYCHKCSCYTSYFEDQIQTYMFPILRKNDSYTEQYDVECLIGDKKTIIRKIHFQLVLEGLPFTPQNIKTKLPLYLLFT